MPKLDGLGACRKIREFSSTPIIFLSAYGEEKGVTFDYDLQESVKIKADRDLIALVIDNFLSNAVKNADENGAIRVTFHKKGLRFIMTEKE